MHHIYNSTAPTYLCDLISFSSTRCLSLEINYQWSSRCTTHTYKTGWPSLSLSLVQEFGTISQPHSDKLFLPLLSKDNCRLTFLAVRFRVNIRLLKVLIYMYFIVVMRSRPLFLCMLRTTNPSFDLIWFEKRTRGGGRFLLYFPDVLYEWPTSQNVDTRHSHMFCRMTIDQRQ